MKGLLKISLIVSFLGILLLLFLSNLEPKLTTISELNKTKLDSIVKIQGRVINSRQLDKKLYALTIKDETGEIEVLAEKNFPKNKTLEIIGKLVKYQEKQEIEAETVKVLL